MTHSIPVLVRSRCPFLLKKPITECYILNGEGQHEKLTSGTKIGNSDILKPLEQFTHYCDLQSFNVRPRIKCTGFAKITKEKNMKVIIKKLL